MPSVRNNVAASARGGTHGGIRRNGERHRPAGAAQGGFSLGDRQGPFWRRHRAAVPGACLLCALAARPCPHRPGRQASSTCGTGGARGAHRRRLLRRWARPDPAQSRALGAARGSSAAVRRAADAIAPGAPTLWDEAPDNVCIDIEVGAAAATAGAFAGAAHVVRLDTWAQRVTGVPMEPRTIAADYDAASLCYTIYTGSGRGVAKVRTDLAQILGVPAERVRCVCGDMGGNFGTRNLFYPEYALLAW